MERKPFFSDSNLLLYFQCEHIQDKVVPSIRILSLSALIPIALKRNVFFWVSHRLTKFQVFLEAISNPHPIITKENKFVKKISLLGLLVSGFSATFLVLSTKPAGAVTFNCPQIGASSNCGTRISIDPDSAGNPVTTITNTGIAPYDGSDDALVGITNNLVGSSVNSITLSGTGNGGGIFAFDGDGLCSIYTTCSYSHPTTYEGPTTTFSGISTFGNTGTVNFTGGLAPGSGTYFSLEGSPQSASITSGPIQTQPVPSSPVPEPSLILGNLVGLVGFGAMLRRKLQRRNCSSTLG